MVQIENIIKETINSKLENSKANAIIVIKLDIKQVIAEKDNMMKDKSNKHKHINIIEIIITIVDVEKIEVEDITDKTINKRKHIK